eukprot:3782-Heterococcus_DN1.PRE.2
MVCCSISNGDAAQHCQQGESLTLPVASATALFFIAACSTNKSAAASSDTKCSIIAPSSDSSSAEAAVLSRRLWGLSIVRPVVSSRSIKPSLKLLENNTQHCNVCDAINSSNSSNKSSDTAAAAAAAAAAAIVSSKNTAKLAHAQCFHARTDSSSSSGNASNCGAVVSSVTAAGGSVLCVQEGAVLRWNAASGHCDQIIAAATTPGSSSSSASGAVSSVSCSTRGANSSRSMLAVATAKGSVDVYMFKGLY